jgi:hypothetical protein
VQLLRDRLPAAVSRGVVIRQLPGGGRHVDASDRMRETVPDAVAEFAATAVTDVLDRLDSERGAGGLAAEGVAGTLGALADGRVHTLLVADDPQDTRVAWFSDDMLCAEKPSAPATPTLSAGRLVDVAIRAAVLTGAEIIVIPPAQDRMPAERIGAVCRYLPPAP